jgi:hypothetical protein
MKTLLKKSIKTILLIAAIITAFLILYTVFNLNLFHQTKSITPAEISTYIQDIDKESSNPFRFVADQFNDHDVVFIGELHKRKQDLEFLNKLIPYLYQAKKINIIGWEFGAAEYQADADSVVTAADFDRRKAIAIMRRSMYFWCYEEYLDVFKTIWQINKTIANDGDKIRFLQLNRPYDLRRLRSADKNTRLEEESKGNFDNTLPGIVEREAISKNKKILIYCGLHHALTKFHTPKIFFFKDKGRAGQVLYGKYPGKIFQISLLSPYPPRWFIYRELTHDRQYKFVYPFDAVFNQLYDTFKRPFAVNSNDPLFANIKDFNSFYAFDTWSGIKLKDFCDGIIMLNAFDKIEPVNIISDWVTTNEELNEVKKKLPEEDARQIRSIPDFINYINPAGDINAVKAFHNLEKFWK